MKSHFRPQIVFELFRVRPCGGGADSIFYDEDLVRKMMERVTVYEEKFVVEFKVGISLDVERKLYEIAYLKIAC